MYTINTKILKGYDSYILFGAFAMGRQALKQLSEAGIKVKYFSDNNKDLWHKKIDGVTVVPPEQMPSIVKCENALVIICSSYAKHLIAAQLEEMNVPYVYFSKPIFVEITSFCNHTCTFCPYEYIERKKGNLDFNLVREFLYDLQSDRSDVIYPVLYPHVLGEPLVSNHFFDFLDLCKELGIYVCIVTNFALMDKKIQERIFTNYSDLDIVLSVQGPTETVFHWRGEKKLTHAQWIDRIFEIIESKFQYGHGGLIQICTLYPNVVNKILTRSDKDLHVFEWYKNAEEFAEWKREFGGRCKTFAEKIKQKYPENYEKAKKIKNPILYYYNLYWLLNDLDEYIAADGPAQYEFLPNVHIYGKEFGIWGVEKYFKALLPDDKYLYWEDNWHALTEKCDRVGDVSLLSSGQLVSCNIDNEADFVFADFNKGEKYSDVKTQERIRELRDNLSLNPLCRRCKSRALVFDTDDIDGNTQEIVHYGIRWHKKCKNDRGETYRISYELSSAFVYPRIDAVNLLCDIESVQEKKQFTLIKILSYDSETKCFTELAIYSVQLKPGERKSVQIPHVFERARLHRIDFITATQRDNGVDNGVAVYSAELGK